LRKGKIKTVFIDMDGTLVQLPSDFSAPRFLQQVLHELGHHFDFEKVERAYQEVKDWWREHFTDATLFTRKNFVEHYNRRFLLKLGLDHKEGLEALAERLQDRWERLPEEVEEELYPEARAALEELKGRGITLGVLSHRTLPLIRSSLRKHGISHYFSVLVSPQVANAPRGKLDPAMWEYALGKVGASAEEAAHIGNSYEHDALGARTAGVLPILMDRDGEYSEADCLKAKDLMEAVRLLF